MNVRGTAGWRMPGRSLAPSPATEPVTEPAAAPIGPLVAGVVVLSMAGLARRTTRQVRALREAGARVAPLRHDLDLGATIAGDTAGQRSVDDHRLVVVLGDSAAAGHGLGDPELGLARRLGRTLHAADGRATTVRSVAVDGATTSDVRDTQLDAARDAEVVVIGVGVNDAVRPRTSRRVRRELDAVLTGVRTAASPGAQVVLITCPDLSVAAGLPRVLRPPMGWRCRSVARTQLALARDLDVDAVPLDRQLLTPEVFGPDGFHPGAVGHERLADAVAALVRDATSAAAQR